MSRINLTANQKDYLVLRICVHYRRGMTIESACNEVFEDAFEDAFDLSAGQAKSVRVAAIKELKKNSDWRY